MVAPGAQLSSGTVKRRPGWRRGGASFRPARPVRPGLVHPRMQGHHPRCTRSMTDARTGGFTHDPCVDCRYGAGAGRSSSRHRSARKIPRDDSRARNQPARRTTLRGPGVSRPRSLSTDKVGGGRAAGNARIDGPPHPPVPRPIRRHGAIERQRSRHIVRQLHQADGPRSPARHQALKAASLCVIFPAIARAGLQNAKRRPGLLRDGASFGPWRQCRRRGRCPYPISCPE